MKFKHLQNIFFRILKSSHLSTKDTLILHTQTEIVHQNKFVKRPKMNANQIDAKESDYLIIDKSQLANAGQGLYTIIPIYKEEIIAYFKGEVLTERQIHRRLQKDEDKYFISMIDGRILDSMKKKCYAKYANDAKGYTNSNFNNNAQITFDEHHHICLIATRNIKAGEEIFCSYGKRYWRKHG